MISLEKTDVLKIRKTHLIRKYGDTTSFAGQNYHIFAFREQAFVVHENDAFLKDFADGEVYSLELSESDEGLSLMNYQTIAQVRKMEQAVSDIAKIQAGTVTVALNPTANYEALS